MGITKLIPWMKELAPAAFHAEESADVPNVFVFDAAGGLHRALRARNQKSSAMSFFRTFSSDLREWLRRIEPLARNSPDDVFDAVVVMDKSGHVSPMKMEEQKQRRAQVRKEVESFNAKARKDAIERGVVPKSDEIVPLPDGYVFTDSYDENGTVCDEGDQDRFYGLSILISNGGTDALLAYFDDSLRSMVLPGNVRLWVDMREGLAYCRKASGVEVRGEHEIYHWECTPYEPEVIGEGEIACVYYAVKLAWARSKGDHSIVIRSDDTDVVPLLFSAKAHLPPTTHSVKWLLRQGSQEWVDLFAVFEALRALHFTPSKFVYYCAFRGCDHVNKAALSDRVRDKDMMEAFVQLCRDTADRPVWDTVDDVHLLTWHANPKLRVAGAGTKVVVAARDKATNKTRRVNPPAQPRCHLAESVVARLLELHGMWNPNWAQMRPLPQ